VEGGKPKGGAPASGMLEVEGVGRGGCGGVILCLDATGGATLGP
jgi:hypothetical protein